MVENGVHPARLPSSTNLVPFGRRLHERVMQGALSWKACLGASARASVPWNVLSDEQAPYLVSVEGKSIVDKPGACWTRVRENHWREPGSL